MHRVPPPELYTAIAKTFCWVHECKVKLVLSVRTLHEFGGINAIDGWLTKEVLGNLRTRRNFN
jgi:hypothetical protein